jgi:hypothetical protein
LEEILRWFFYASISINAIYFYEFLMFICFNGDVQKYKEKERFPMKKQFNIITLLSVFALTLSINLSMSSLYAAPPTQKNSKNNVEKAKPAASAQKEARQNQAAFSSQQMQRQKQKQQQSEKSSSSGGGTSKRPS